MFRIEQATSLIPSETPPKKGLIINFKAPTELFTPFGTLVRENLLQVEVKALRDFAAPATSRFLVPEEACLLV